MHTRSKSLSDLTLDDLRQVVRDELKEEVLVELRQVIHDEIKPVAERLDRLEQQMKLLSDLKQQMSGIENSLQFVSRRVDDVYQVSLPALATHVEKVATALAMQTMDIDVHRRKWSLTIHGLKGPAQEDDTDTRKACVKLAREQLGIDASLSDFAACHRLSRSADAGIIMCFRDLGMRNQWLDNAKKLKDYPETISIGPDLPPVLREIKTELLRKRKNLPPDQKKRANIKYLRQWPYLQLAVGANQPIPHKKKKEAIVAKVLGFCPHLAQVEPTR